MLNLGIHRRLHDALLDTLIDTHRIKILVRIHDHDEKAVSHFQFGFANDHLLSGSVQVDATADVTRSLNLTVLDPKRRLIFAPDSPAHGVLYAGFFISVEYCVWVPKPGRFPDHSTFPSHTDFPDAPTPHDAGDWVHIPVFWGPLTSFQSAGAEVTLEAQGKETLLLSPYLTTKGYPLKKHTRIDDAIQRVAAKAGEARFDLPDLPYKLEKDRVVHSRSEPWRVIAGGETDSSGKKIRGLVDQIGKHPHQVLYDGRGRLAVKRLNKEPVFTFDKDTLLSRPTLSFDATIFKNHVVVRGAKLKGKGKDKGYAHAEVSLPAEHPLSPDSLSRNGVPRYLTLNVDAGHLKTDKACAERAYHLLQHHSEIGVDVSFDCLPIPMLEEHDVVLVENGPFSTRFPIRQMTIPLTSDSPMTIGTHKRAGGKRQRTRGPGQSPSPGAGGRPSTRPGQRPRHGRHPHPIGNPGR